MSPQFEIWPVLELLEDLERKVIALYDALREKFKDDEGAANLFKLLSQDENRHLNIVKFELGMVFRSRNEYRRVEADKEAIKAAALTAKMLLDSAAALDLEDALRSSLRLEEDGAEIYYRTKIVEANPKIAGIIHSLASAEKKHVERILEFAKERGVEVSLEEKTATAAEEDVVIDPPDEDPAG
jgi:rubrerythrin